MKTGSLIEYKNNRIGYITSIKDNRLLVRFNGNESITTIYADDVTNVLQVPTSDEKEFIRLLESDSGLIYNDVLKKNKKRIKDLVEFRMLHIYFLLEVCKYTTHRSAAIYELDHATSIHARKKIRFYYHFDRQFRIKYAKTLQYILEFNKTTFDD